MIDLVALLTLIGGGIVALAVALFRARRKGASDATQTLERKEARHAQDIAEDVANARAARKAPPPRPDAAGAPVERLPAQPYGDRGWRD